MNSWVVDWFEDWRQITYILNIPIFLNSSERNADVPVDALMQILWLGIIYVFLQYEESWQPCFSELDLTELNQIHLSLVEIIEGRVDLTDLEQVRKQYH